MSADNDSHVAVWSRTEHLEDDWYQTSFKWRVPSGDIDTDTFVTQAALKFIDVMTRTINAHKGGNH